MGQLKNEDKKNMQQQNERIFILTRFGKNLLKHVFLFFLLAFAVSMLLFNWQLLTENPFSVELHWYRPLFACRNIHGNTVVVDNHGKRVVVLDKDRKFQAQFQKNPLSRKAISSIMDVAVDDKYIYLLDLQHSPNGVQIDGERVLVYDLNGQYVETAYELSHPDATQREHVLCDVSCYNGKIFVSKRENGRLSIYQIVDKNLKLVQTLDLPGKVIFNATYMPDTKSTYVITRDGCCYLNYQNNLETLTVPDKKTHWNDVYVSPSGDRYYLDSNKHEILRFRPNMKKKEFIQFSSRDEIKTIPDVFGLWMSFQDDILTWCCFGKNEIILFDTSTWTKTVLSSVPQTRKFLLFRGVIWLCLLVVSAFIVKHLIIGTLKRFQKFRKRYELNTLETKSSGGKFNLFNMYGQNAFTLLFAFIAVTCIITIFYADQTRETMRASVKSTASELKGLPGNVFGDYLAKINSPGDYNSDVFKVMHQVAGSICFSSEGATFDMGLSILRKLSNGEYMYVVDNSDRYPIGKIIDKNDPDLTMFHQVLSGVSNDKLTICNQKHLSRFPIYFVLAKIFDSNQKEAGIIMISFNMEKVYSEILHMLVKLSVDLLLLFVIFVLLSGEIKLTLEFRKLRKVQPGTGKLLHTVCEGHRSCLFMSTMSLYLDVAFLPTLAIELAKSSGIRRNAHYLVALPLSLRTFMLVFALALGGFLAKYRPALFLKCSALFSICCYLFQIYAVLAGQYTWFLIGIAALGIMYGLKFASLDAISSSGLQPDSRFKNLVFVNTESLIGAAVGTSVGSLLCAKFGYIAVFMLAIYLEISLFTATNSFISDDINLHNVHSLMHHTKQTLWMYWLKIKNNIRHILRPEQMALLFCVMIPISILSQFDSYFLPVYNAWSGYSQLLTGFTGTVTKVLALVLIPYVFHHLAERGNRLPIIAGMFFISAGLLFFAFDTSSLLLMGLLLLLITIFDIVFITSSERLRLALANEDHVKYSDVIGFFHVFQYLGASVAPILMGYLLKFGFRIFGLILAVTILVLLVLFYMLSSHFRRSKIGPCL